MIELTVVIALLMILAAMGMAQYKTSVVHAREATLKEDLFRMRDAIDQYFADKAQYPATLDALGRSERVRRLHDLRRPGPRWDEIQGLVETKS